MVEEAQVAFYRVTRCGYYGWGKEAPEYGQLPGIMGELVEWLDGKPVSETCTFEGDADAEKEEAYFVSITPSANGSEYLLVTWNRVSSEKGATAALSGSSLVGSPEVSQTVLSEGAIPGFATYFWVLPEQGLFLTVRFAARSNGRKGLESLVTGFLANACPRHVVTGTPEGENGDVEILGYRRSPGEATQPNLRPRFASSAIRQMAELDFLRSNRESIIKVHQRATLEGGQPKRPIFRRIVESLGVLSAPTVSASTMRIQFAVNMTPTQAQLEELLTAELESASPWDDTGFALKSDPYTIRWINSGALVRGELFLDVSRDAKQMIQPESMLRDLQRQRGLLMQLIGG